jgi:hypothetical protein
MKIKDLIIPLNGKISEYIQYSGNLDAIEIDLSKLLDTANLLDGYWGQSWTLHEFDLYRRNLDKSSEGFDHFQSEEISEYIEESSNISLDPLEEELSQLLKPIKKIQDDIISDLCLIRSDSNFSSEIELLDRIEKIEWDSIVGTLDQAQAPKRIITSDISVINSGLRVPPHIHYKSKILNEMRKISNIRDLLKISQRLFRQIEIKTKFEVEVDKETALFEINRICKKFSNISRQLQARYADRDTICINDEYDVQDLFHALLKLFFTDIRSEEWTPSYAGSSSRMDFLLKNEKIVIEIKKTRPTLKDKDLGEQLLIDIARYEQHPDCKILICFVYDPERRIGNPIAIMNDLNQKSTEKMHVIVIIEPSD